MTDAMLRYLIFLLLISTIYSDYLWNTIPPNIACEQVTICHQPADTKICGIVCKPGTVQIERWIRDAIQLQNNMSYQMPFCYLTLPGSHNSAIDMANGYGIDDIVYTDVLKYLDSSWFLRSNNQYFSLTDQLNFGVRFIELDTHWVLKELRIAHCGGLHVSVVDDFLRLVDWIQKKLGLHILDWDTETVGCDPSLSSIPADKQRSLQSAFAEVSNWLSINQNDFLMIFFDDQKDLKWWGRVEILVSFVKEYFGNRLYTIEDYTSNNNSFPTMAQMITSGKQILLMSGTDYGERMKPYIFYKYGPQLCNWYEPSLEQIDFDNCVVWINETYSILSYNGTLFRPETAQLVYGPYYAGRQSQLGHLSSTSLPRPEKYLNNKTLVKVMRCGINVPSPDLITPKRIAAQVWSWAPNEPRFTNGTATISAHDGRWRTCQESLKIPKLCRKTDSPLYRSDFVVAHDCPEGFVWDHPWNPVDNWRVVEMLRSNGIKQIQLNFNFKIN